MAVIHASAVAALLLSLAACQPARPGAEDAATAELRAKGYARAPEITSVVEEGTTFVVYGVANKGGRVNLKYLGANDAGLTLNASIGGEVDKEGVFRIPEVPVGPHGGLYDLLATDSPRSQRESEVPADTSAFPTDLPSDERGRWLHAEGKLFVPRGHPEKAVVLRAGVAGRPVSVQNQIIAEVDYDGRGGIAVAGRVAPDITVNLVVGGVMIGRSQSDADGRYQVLGQISAPGEAEVVMDIEITTEKQSQTRAVPISLPPGGDRITPIEGGWRVDWGLPGGGVQTSVVF
ncbi:hypothetical protein ABAC460_05225 [Asticcacaulis sp. AC460]|uniref:hypothetical protein n=1 Tax=Asticcacaulis sp. AC460 TaxID=1282360 RepID=UPI0003C3D799|nr:hypothetical protein [Asticcacaulis sp. AC460]ESQ91743.1 hypothetical protein ABAC460_05225 [Asticcacaulis sp. AC460]